MKVTVLKKGIGGGGKPVGCPWLIDHEAAMVTVAPGPSIPAGVPEGRYYIGVILSFTDFNTGNNESDGTEAAALKVCASEPCSIFSDDFEDGELLTPLWGQGGGTWSVVEGRPAQRFLDVERPGFRWADRQVAPDR